MEFFAGVGLTHQEQAGVVETGDQLGNGEQGAVVAVGDAVEHHGALALPPAVIADRQLAGLIAGTGKTGSTGQQEGRAHQAGEPGGLQGFAHAGIRLGSVGKDGTKLVDATNSSHG